MRNLCLICLLCVAMGGLAIAQDYPRAEVYGGYSYVNIDTNGLSDRQNANGWEASVSGNFNKWFAAEADVSGYYKTYSVPGVADVKVTDYSYLAGPRINFRPVFVHALLGGDHLTGSALGFSESQDGFAGAFGGGIQEKVSGPWSIRAGVDYVFTRHNIFGGPSFTQNNVRVGVGIVYSFGGTAAENRSSGVSQQAPHVRASRPAMPIPALGIIATTAAPDSHVDGAEISEVFPNSAAELANLHVGDLITSVDGQPVKSPMELAAELSKHAAGSPVKLGYMFHSVALGYYPKETNIILMAH
jgi:opacity protein-like surface antigen